MKDRRFVPNLFILGAARCGTTFLYHYLRSSEEICMSRPKEPFFFEYEYDKGLDFYRKKYFPHWKGEKLIGEGRHRNLYLPFVPESIFETSPSAKLIISVRNPVERAYSHWWWDYSRRRIGLNFEEALEKNYQRIARGIKCLTRKEYKKHFNPDFPVYMNTDTYIDSGYYHEQVQRYRRYFSDEQIKVVLFDDLAKDPEKLFGELDTFLGIRISSFNGAAVKKNAAKELMDIKAVETLVRYTWFRRLKDLIPAQTRMKIKKIYNQIFFSEEKASEKTCDWLFRHYYERNRDLEKYIKRDLSHWDQKIEQPE